MFPSIDNKQNNNNNNLLFFIIFIIIIKRWHRIFGKMFQLLVLCCGVKNIKEALRLLEDSFNKIICILTI